jgi:hypothetical protein
VMCERVTPSLDGRMPTSFSHTPSVGQKSLYSNASAFGCPHAGNAAVLPILRLNVRAAVQDGAR